MNSSAAAARFNFKRVSLDCLLEFTVLSVVIVILRLFALLEVTNYLKGFLDFLFACMLSNDLWYTVCERNIDLSVEIPSAVCVHTYDSNC